VNRAAEKQRRRGVGNATISRYQNGKRRLSEKAGEVIFGFPQENQMTMTTATVLHNRGRVVIKRTSKHYRGGEPSQRLKVDLFAGWGGGLQGDIREGGKPRAKHATNKRGGLGGGGGLLIEGRGQFQ